MVAATTRSAAAATRAARATTSAPWPMLTPLAEIDARPSFASRTMTGMPARRMASAPDRRSPWYSAAPSPMSTRAMQAIDIRSDAPTDPYSGTMGCTPASSIAGQCPRRDQRHAAATAGDAGQANGHRRADDARRQRPPDGALVETHDGDLVGGQRIGRHALVAHVPEARVQAVDRLRSREMLLDDVARGEDQGLGVRQQLDPRTIGDAHDVVDAQGIDADPDGVRRRGRSRRHESRSLVVMRRSRSRDSGSRSGGHRGGRGRHRRCPAAPG